MNLNVLFRHFNFTAFFQRLRLIKKYISHKLGTVGDGGHLAFLEDDFKFEGEIGVHVLEEIDIFA